MQQPSPYIALSDEVQTALQAQQSVVALESTVIAHGLPYPANIEVAYHGAWSLGHSRPRVAATGDVLQKAVIKRGRCRNAFHVYNGFVHRGTTWRTRSFLRPIFITKKPPTNLSKRASGRKARSARIVALAMALTSWSQKKGSRSTFARAYTSARLATNNTRFGSGPSLKIPISRFANGSWRFT